MIETEDRIKFWAYKHNTAHSFLPTHNTHRERRDNSSTMATLSYCSSLTTTPLSHKQATTQTLILPHSKINLGFLSPPPLHSLSSSLKLTTSSPFSSLSFVPKSSEIEAPVVESEPVSAEIEPAEVVETAIAEPKPEQVFAVVVVSDIIDSGILLFCFKFVSSEINLVSVCVFSL